MSAKLAGTVVAAEGFENGDRDEADDLGRSLSDEDGRKTAEEVGDIATSCCEVILATVAMAISDGEVDRRIFDGVDIGKDEREGRDRLEV